MMIEGSLCVIVAILAMLTLVLLLFSRADRAEPRPFEATLHRASVVSSHFESACPVCGDERGTWGLVSVHENLRYWPLGESLQPHDVVAFRCQTCGHLMFFTDPPEHIKRKRQSSET